ncbi:MAG: SRPBCC family protein [Bacteroidia bacterium]|nr:SRPBCC family protein [Bacteroidia bacterium]
MKILKRILWILAVFLFLVTAVGILFFPSRIHIERSVIVHKDSGTVFRYLNNLKNWNNWSPWFDLDTTASYTFEGPASGPGAKMNWTSRIREVGAGSIEIIATEENQRIQADYRFMDKGLAHGNFQLEETGNGTKLSWSLDFNAGWNPLLRILGTFMDGVAGKDIEKGLDRIKNNLEPESK